MTADPDFTAYRNVLYESLAGAAPGIGDASPVDILRRVSVEAFRLGPDSAESLKPLNDIAATTSIEAAITVARSRYATPAAFRDAIYFARCLGRDVGQALRLLTARTYLLEAHLPASPRYADLRTDRQGVLDTTTFEVLWKEPQRIDGLLNLTRLWQQAYFRPYAEEHAAHQASIAGVFEQMEGLRVAASALQRLNGLQRLGPPVAVAALEQQQGMERLFPCPSGNAALATSLSTSPFCRECGYRLGSSAPTAEARRVSLAIERGLASQQVRLARRVIVRLLAREAPEPEAKLRRFIEVVQASDLNALASVLDDEIIAFLDDLLSDGEGATTVLARLARAFPAVTPSNLEAAVGEFRRLLTDETAREGIVRLRNPNDARPSR